MTHSGSGLPALVAALAACVVLFASGCGGGGSSASMTSGPPPQAANLVSVVIDAGPTDPAALSAGAIDTVNTPFVSVTICAHGTSNCETIDHISVDTQSTGLRVISSVLSSSLASALTPVMDTQNRPLVECLPFADGYSWGPVKQADAKIGGEEAAGISIQVIGDPAYPDATVPSSCSSQAKTAEDTVTTFGANGILGIASFKQDCGMRCVTDPSPNLYYGCPTAATCVATTVALTGQVWNPVALFATDNNGTILELPSVGASGTVSVSGTLIFGIDTQSNNALGTATVLTVDPGTGNLTVTYNNQSLSNSFIDSGSNGIFFSDSSLTQCTHATGFYCPASTLSVSATLTSSNAVTTNVSFSVANAETLFNGNTSFAVFNDLGGTNDLPQSFDFGLPFFLGRHVYNAIEGASTSAGAGPYVAY